ncbi:MazG nucleotide pyrophosphohydrolase domain-containing protein [Corynebacterium sp. MSK008]|uniref:MazG nucleotide pyrophosphohydrolase domain-containing protein n=1 Tax=Corynebacterium sp. MSK008 TaxID=3050188 RepID=UPI00255103DC|nr:MazG nucleotide pyrophosphohydrolase domain-containing protein [Corynebacterium sp. MSK008]MDK8878237.1 MazG nucleotide pyrophosphohydrolase domain-containing protein [Corynebacterium sp. MSK008]
MTATVLLLDPRWPSLIPLNLAGHIRGDVAFTPEVPVDVRWALNVEGGPEKWLISTDPHDPEVLRWQGEGAETERVASLDDPVFEATRTMHAARRRGEWEQAMTHESLLPFLREEAEEVAQAIEQKLPIDDLKSELSDLLLQILFHAEIASESGAFDFGDVADAFVQKMCRRAPYLFDGSTGPVDKATQDRLWEEGKAVEKR